MTEEKKFVEKLNQYEDKWQEKWEKNQVFEVDPENKEKFYITVAYPYPSGGMHVGHARTDALPDIFARFKRMQGYNVLFPMAWHVTGTPIIGALERLKEGEEEQINVLRDTYNVPEEDLESMEEPMDFAEYFIENSYKPNMKNLGLSIDWRREFTTNDETYNKFIEWQYKRLRKQGLVKKGLHPTKYCLNDENPVTTHDILEGETAEKQEYTLVKFSDKENTIFPCATLRPETVYGVTHLMVKPSEEYLKAKVDDETWIISEQAKTKLKNQERKIDTIDKIKGKKLIGKKLTNPVTGEQVPVLPASFIDPDSGSGVVMSVPAHAPYDYISLKDIQKDEETLKKFDLDIEEIQNIEPKVIINAEGYEKIPAKEECEKQNIDSQEDTEKLEKATEEVYEKEFHTGTLNADCQDFAGQKVNQVKEKLVNQFENMGRFDSMYDFSEKVVCRCGGKVIVGMQESWFLEYGKKPWKDKVQKNLSKMNVIPGEKRQDYEHTIDWLESWPAIRNYGLGTKLPFDRDFVVEPLSDSTIYMAYYTISHLIKDVNPEKLKPIFFDHIFNKEPGIEKVIEETGLEKDLIEKCRKSFKYWYPLDWRTSGHDLIQNHLTFMMYHHTALFNEDYWPQGVATWGMGLLEGKKMSSSKGHVVLPDNAIQEYGADTVRFFLFASAEPWQEWDWRAEQVKDYKNKIENFYKRSKTLYNTGENREKTSLDKYALSKLQEIIKETTEALEDFQTRKAGLNAFFELNSLINQYRKRSQKLNKEVINQLIKKQIKLMAPFTPHICEELYHQIGEKEFVSNSKWPEPQQKYINKEVEEAQNLVEKTVSDIREVSEIVENYKEIKLIVAEKWKRNVFKEIEEMTEERPEMNEAMSNLVEGREEKAEKIKDYLKEYLENPGELPEKIFPTEKELEILEENKNFLEEEFNAKVTIEKEKNSEEEKASRSEPGKPSIVMK